MSSVPERADPNVQTGTGAVVGWRCAVCGATVGIDTPLPFRCPRASAGDPYHVLHPVTSGPPLAPFDHPNPFVAYGPRLAWWAFARSHGMSVDECVALTEQVAAGFAVTPYGRSDVLSDALGGDVWVKDETANVGGSHKARHLVTTLLHLRAASHFGLAGVEDGERSPLAIASCGNAAVAAATLAAAADWPLRVFVPEWADAAVLSILDDLHAEVSVSPRRAEDPPGDPAVLRFREAVAAGARPFSVQGPENALCLDGGRTLGWELADAPSPPRRVVIQVGGGAFATDVGWGLGPDVRLDTVQAEGAAPLARTWHRAAPLPDDELGARWSELMTPWDDPHSAASGILDDETYDWLGVVEVMRRSGGHPLVAPETDIGRAHELAVRTGIPVSVTGAAGLAGLLVEPPEPGVTTAVVFSGVAR